MNSIEHRSGRTVSTLFLCAQFLLPLVSIGFFQHHYGYPPRTIFYHEILVVLGYLALFGLAILPGRVRAVRNWPATRYLLPLLWGGLTVALYLAHLLAWAGRLGAGMNFTPSMLLPYVLHPSLVVGTLPVPLVVFWGALVAIPLAVLLAYLVAAPSFFALLLRLQTRFDRLRRKRFSAVERCGVVGGCAGLAVLANVGFARWSPPATVLQLFGDPIFVSMTEGSTLLPVHDLGTASDEARNRYQPPAQFQKRNVILVVVDSLRADHLGLLGYARDNTPFLDSLQRSGHLHAVRNFYSASCCTFGGVMSLLRSKHWFKMSRHGFRAPGRAQKGPATAPTSCWAVT